MRDKKMNQSGNIETPQESPESFAEKTVETYRKLSEKPKETVGKFINEKIDVAKIGLVDKASTGIYEVLPEPMKKITDLVEKHTGVFWKIKELFSGKIGEIIKDFLAFLGKMFGGVFGGLELAKKGIEQVVDFAKQGKEMFISFLDGLSFAGLDRFTDKIRDFVDNLDLKQSFSNAAEAFEEIKRKVAAEFPEVAYYFAIDAADETKDDAEKVNKKQVALFEYALRHFGENSEIKPGLKAKLRLLKEKTEKGGYESLTEEDWEDLEKELKKNEYNLKEVKGLYYFNKIGGADYFILGYLPEQKIEEASEIDVGKLAISNVIFQKILEGTDVVKDTVAEPLGEITEALKNTISPELKEHLKNYDYDSLVWYKNFWNKLELSEIPYVVTDIGTAFYKGWTWYVIESYKTMGTLLCDSAKIPFANDKWKQAKNTGIEFGKNAVPIMVVGGTLWWTIGIIKIPFRMAQSLVGGGLSPLTSIPVDILWGAVKWFTAPVRITGKTLYYWYKTVREFNEIKITLNSIKNSVKHIPKTTVVKAQHFGHQVKTPFRGMQKLVKLRHKDELLYQELLENKKLYRYYEQRRKEWFFPEKSKKLAGVAKKRYEEINNIISRRGNTLLDQHVFKGSIEKYNRLVADKLSEIDWDVNLRKRFFEYLRKNQLISAENAANFNLSKELEVLKIRDDWYKKEAITQLRKDWKLGPIKTLMTKMEEGMKSKIRALKNSAQNLFWTTSVSSSSAPSAAAEISEELAERTTLKNTSAKPNDSKSAEKIIKNELGNDGLKLSAESEKKLNTKQTQGAPAEKSTSPQQTRASKKNPVQTPKAKVLETVGENVDDTVSQGNLAAQKKTEIKPKASVEVTQETTSKVAKQTEAVDDKVDDALKKAGRAIEKWTKAPTAKEIQEVALKSGEIPATTEQLTKDKAKNEKLWKKFSQKIQDPQIQKELWKGMAGIAVALFLNGLSKAEDKSEFIDEYSKHGITGFAWFKTGTTVWKSAAGMPVLARLWASLVWAAATLFGWQKIWEKAVTQPTAKYLPNLEKHVNDMDLDTLALWGSLATGPVGAAVWGTASIYDAGKVAKHTFGWGLDINEDSDPLDYLEQTATGIELKKVIDEGVNQYHFTDVADWNKEVDEAIQEYKKKEEIQNYERYNRRSWTAAIRNGRYWNQAKQPKKDYQAKIAKLEKMRIDNNWFEKKEKELETKQSLHESLLDEFIEKTKNTQKTEAFIQNLKTRLIANGKGENVKKVQNSEEKEIWKELCSLEIVTPVQSKMSFLQVIGLLEIDYNQQDKITQIKKHGRLKDKHTKPKAKKVEITETERKKNEENWRRKNKLPTIL